MIFILLLVFVGGNGIWNGVYCQPDNTNQITVEDGLSQGFVSDMIQDDLGFLWIGTFYGLNRYDGYRFKQYNYDPFDSLSIPDNFIRSLYDYQDFLIIGTNYSGFGILHKPSNRCFRFPTNQLDEVPAVMTGSIPPFMITNIAVDDKGDIWIVANKKHTNSYVLYIHTPDGFWNQLPERPSLLKQLKIECSFERKGDKNIRLGVSKDGKQINLLNNDQLYYYDVEHQKWIENNRFSIELPIRLGRTPVQEVIVDARQQIIPLSNAQDDDFRVLETYPTSLLYKKGDNMLVKTITDPAAFQHLNTKEEKIPYDDDTSIAFIDRCENIFIHWSANGLLHLSNQRQRFQHLEKGNSVRSPVWADSSGQIFWHTIQDGFRFVNENPNSLLKSTLTSIRDRFGRHAAQLQFLDNKLAWLFGTKRNGAVYLAKINLNTGQVKVFHYDYEIRDINSFLVAPNGYIWMPLERALLRFDPVTEQSKYYDLQHLPKGEQVFAVSEVGDRIFLATDNGLQWIKPATGETGYYHVQENKEQSLSSPFVLSLLPDPKDSSLLWIGTKGGGLNCLNLNNNKIRHFNHQNGLPDNVIYGILPDKDGNLWMSSNKGIIWLSPYTGAVKNYRKVDGLQSNEFNTFGYGMAPDGRMMFAGVNGINVFHPDSMQLNSCPPSVRITNLMVNGQEIEAADSSGILAQNICYTSYIELDYDQNNIKLEFAALDFTATTKNRYRFYLEGAEANWPHEQDQPSATYLNLRPGTYTFYLQGSNSDGIWSGDITQLKIKIFPPWYQSTLAYAFYIISLLSTLLAVHLFRQRQQKLRFTIQLRELELKRQREEVANKMKIEQLKVEELSQKLEMKRKEAEHQQLLHQIKLEEYTSRLIEKSALLQQLQQKRAIQSDPVFQQQSIQEISKLRILTAEDWEQFLLLFENVYPGFLNRLQVKYPNLTKAEIRLSLLLKINFGRQKIADMLGISPETVKKTRQRLRKKIDLPEDSSIESIIQSI